MSKDAGMGFDPTRRKTGFDFLIIIGVVGLILFLIWYFSPCQSLERARDSYRHNLYVGHYEKYPQQRIYDYNEIETLRRQCEENK